MFRTPCRSDTGVDQSRCRFVADALADTLAFSEVGGRDLLGARGLLPALQRHVG
jgi:hypothetical protein